MINFKQLLNWPYLTEIPTDTIQWQMPILIGLAVLTVLGIVLYLLHARQSRKQEIVNYLVRGWANWLLWPSIIAGILIFFRYQGIIFLSWRLWLLTLLIVWLAGILWMLYLTIFQWPHERAQAQVEDIMNKYIPKPKKQKRR